VRHAFSEIEFHHHSSDRKAINAQVSQNYPKYI